jgi:hypothetical protein
MSMTKYAVIPEGTDMSNIDYLTIGKKYKILRLDGNHDHDNGLGFEIKDDLGDIIYCCSMGSSHLNYQNWEIQE